MLSDLKSADSGLQNVNKIKSLRICKFFVWHEFYVIINIKIKIKYKNFYQLSKIWLTKLNFFSWLFWNFLTQIFFFKNKMFSLSHVYEFIFDYILII